MFDLKFRSQYVYSMRWEGYPEWMEDSASKAFRSAKNYQIKYKRAEVIPADYRQSKGVDMASRV